jgi:hypothetical protein
MQAVSERALQWYSNCYCVVNVTKTFTLKGVQTIRHQHHEMDTLYVLQFNTNVKIFLKHILFALSLGYHNKK